LDWKIGILTFPSIYGRPANSSRLERTTCLKLGLKSARNVRKLEKHCFFYVLWILVNTRILNCLGNMCGRYWLTYFTWIPCQIRRHLWQQLLSIVCKNLISIMEYMWCQGGLGFFCFSFPYFTGFSYSYRRLWETT
jgi:hypothetical protein